MSDIFGQCLIDTLGGGRGGWEVTQGKFGRGEPLQKPDTFEKKIVHFHYPV